MVNRVAIFVGVAAVALMFWPRTQVHEIKGKTALVTGASGGLGVAFARAMVEEGASQVGICARNVAKLEAVKTKLLGEFPDAKVSVFRCDIADADSRTQLVEDINAKFGHLDILVNNAGIEKLFHFEKDTSESLDAQIDINCGGAAHLTHAFIGGMIERGVGHVVNMSSVCGKVGCAYSAMYSASRFFTAGFSAALRAEMTHRKTGVTVHSIHPGFVSDVGMYANALKDRKGKDTSKKELHWLFGTGNTAKDNADGLVQLIKYNLPEWIENTPPFRPTVVMATIWPEMFDYLLHYWPETADFLKEAVADRIEGKTSRNTLGSHDHA